MPIWDSANLDAPHTQRELGECVDRMKAKLPKTLHVLALVDRIEKLERELARMKQERDYEC